MYSAQHSQHNLCHMEEVESRKDEIQEVHSLQVPELRISIRCLGFQLYQLSTLSPATELDIKTHTSNQLAARLQAAAEKLRYTTVAGRLTFVWLGQDSSCGRSPVACCSMTNAMPSRVH